MEITLPTELSEQVQQELAKGSYPSADALITQAVRRLLEESHRGEERLAALRRIGQAVDHAGLYDRVLPVQE